MEDSCKCEVLPQVTALRGVGGAWRLCKPMADVEAPVTAAVERVADGEAPVTVAVEQVVGVTHGGGVGP